MSKRRAKEELLGELHEALAKELLAKVNSGEASAQELNAAIKFLQNNGIEVDKAPGTPTARLADALPSFTDEDNEDYVH